MGSGRFDKHIQCALCPGVFSTDAALSAHVERHGTHAHACSVCFRRYKSVYNRDEHFQFAHGTDFGHSCELCTRRYVRRSDLLRHERNIHGVDRRDGQTRAVTTERDATEWPFPCRHCNRSFRRHGSRLSHERRIHPMAYVGRWKGRPRPAPVRFPCCVPGCGGVFSSGGERSKHYQVVHLSGILPANQPDAHGSHQGDDDGG